MTELIVRRLLIDLETPLPRHWAAGDAFRTALFNALSMSFPVGEQFFIDAVRRGVASLPESERATFDAPLRGFVGQEATHRRIHERFNAHLERQGLHNTWAERARARLARFQGADARHAVAATAATEHFTAIFADWILRRPHLLTPGEARWQTLWLWHAAEESEHRSVAFDVYHALGGDQRWRLRWFRIATVYFLTDLLRQTLRNLHDDGELLRWRTWRSAGSFLFGADGLLRVCLRPWRAYAKPDFHPRQQDDGPGRDWLRAHALAYTPVGSAG
jgi:predicted metal-dependent hydrolase